MSADLPVISENSAFDISVTADLKTAIDPFANAVTSSLGFRLSSMLPVEVQSPKITDKTERIENYYDSIEKSPPDETLTEDYEHFLEYIDEQLEQFYKDHPYRMRVFLTAENENGTRYFLSSFIRPSVLPLLAAHTVELAANFVANLIEYQILFDFFSQPRTITTPNFTVACQKGDCFDMSVLLTTILTGIGYDACVIVGYANRELTLSDLRYRNCPGVAEPPKEDDGDKGPENKYLKAVSGRLLNLESSFVELQKNPPPPPPPPKVIPTPPPDEYDGRRMHCWIMVSKTGRIEIPETIFIDVSTGDKYPITSPLFGYIEVVFNHKNVWINLQPNDFEKSEDSLDFANTDLWQAVIPETDVKIPSPVVERLDVPENEIFRMYPKVVSADGCSEQNMKKLYWSDAIEERYAPYTRQDGLYRRFFIFDKDPSDIREIREQFEHLRQHLVERRIFLKSQEMLETFEPGTIIPTRENNKGEKQQQIGQIYEIKRPIGITTHKIKHNECRLLEFDDTSRIDCLKSRLEVFGTKIVEKFGDRDDGLCERKICIVPESSSSNSETQLYDGGPKIERMTQKYRHPSLVQTHHTTTYAVSHSIYKVAFDFVTNKLTVVYHHQPGCITDFSIEFVTPTEADKDKDYIAIPSKFCPNPPEIDNWTMNEIQNQLLAIRNQGTADAEAIAKEMVQWIQFRTDEESRPFYKMKSVDIVLHRKIYAQGEQAEILVEKPPPEPKAEGEDDASKNQQQLSADDPLCVYFPVDPNTEFTAEVAADIYRKAVTALQDRIYKEAKYLVNRLDQEQTALKSKIREYDMDQHQSRSRKQGDEHNNFVTTKAFLITVLQKRIARFYQTAINRLKDLITKLKNHPKLSPFLGPTDISEEEFKTRIEGILKPKDKKN